MTGGRLRTPANCGYFLLTDFLNLKSQLPPFMKLTGSRSTGPAVLKQMYSASVAQESSGCGSRLLGK